MASLYVSWIGTDRDNSVNVITGDAQLNFGDKHFFEKSRDDAGPALAYLPGLLCVVGSARTNLAWTGLALHPPRSTTSTFWRPNGAAAIEIDLALIDSSV